MIRIQHPTPKRISTTLRSSMMTLLAAAIAFEPSIALADSSPRYAIFSDRYRRCLNKSIYTTDMRDCTAAEYRRASILMDMAYRKVLATLPPDRKKALRQSHKNWQKRVTIECNDALSDEGGTLWPILYTECFIAKTKAHTKWLQKSYAIRG